MITRPRLVALDSVRGLAVLLVVAFHSAFRFAIPSGDPISRFLRTTGWIGVDIFFVLSGFLITKVLNAQRSDPDLPAFAIKRAARIYPLYLVAIGTFALGDLLVNDGKSLAMLPGTVALLTGYLVPLYGEANVPFTITWSLSVEVTAYALFAIVASRSWPAFARMLVLVVLASPVLRLACFLWGWDSAAIGMFPLTRLDGLALGGLAALGKFDKWMASRRGRSLCAIGLAGSLLVITKSASYPWHLFFMSLCGYSLFGLLAAAEVAKVSTVSLPRNPFTKFLEFYGKVSYFVYLFHIFVIELVNIISRYFGLNMEYYLGTAIVLMALIPLGFISWHAFENPIIRNASSFTARR